MRVDFITTDKATEILNLFSKGLQKDQIAYMSGVKLETVNKVITFLSTEAIVEDLQHDLRDK